MHSDKASGHDVDDRTVVGVGAAPPFGTQRQAKLQQEQLLELIKLTGDVQDRAKRLADGAVSEGKEALPSHVEKVLVHLRNAIEGIEIASERDEAVICGTPSDTTPQWRQYHVLVDGKTKLMYLDTSLQGLLYGPSITAVDLNVATQFQFGFPDLKTRALGPFLLRNRVTPSAAPYFEPRGCSGCEILLLPQGTREVYQAHLIRNPGDPAPRIRFAIYALVPDDEDKRIYFRPTPEITGKPRSNQILGYEIPSSEFDAEKNYVFLPGRVARDP